MCCFVDIIFTFDGFGWGWLLGCLWVLFGGSLVCWDVSLTLSVYVVCWLNVRVCVFFVPFLNLFVLMLCLVVVLSRLVFYIFLRVLR